MAKSTISTGPWLLCRKLWVRLPGRVTSNIRWIWYHTWNQISHVYSQIREKVDLPIKNGDFPYRSYSYLMLIYQRISPSKFGLKTPSPQRVSPSSDLVYQQGLSAGFTSICDGKNPWENPMGFPAKILSFQSIRWYLACSDHILPFYNVGPPSCKLV